MSQYWSDAKVGKAYPPIKPQKEHADRARPMKNRVTEILGIECVRLLSQSIGSLCPLSQLARRRAPFSGTLS